MQRPRWRGVPPDSRATPVQPMSGLCPCWRVHPSGIGSAQRYTRAGTSSTPAPVLTSPKPHSPLQPWAPELGVTSCRATCSAGSLPLSPCAPSSSYSFLCCFRCFCCLELSLRCSVLRASVSGRCLGCIGGVKARRSARQVHRKAPVREKGTFEGVS